MSLTSCQEKMTKLQRLFVYGTLAPGRPNEHILSAVGGAWESASVRGTLYPEGWGAQMGYPGMVVNKDGSGEEIKGFLFSSNQLSAHWDHLDAFEGAGYERILIKAELEDGRRVEAFVYVLRRT